MAYYENNTSTWNCLTPPGWPDSSGSATRPSGADTSQALQALFKAKPSGPAPHLDGTQPHSKETFSLHAHQWANFHGPCWGRCQSISTAIHIHDTPVYMATSLEAYLAQRDTMTDRPHADHGISYHLSLNAVSGHYCTAIQDGGTWRVSEDDLVTVEDIFLPWIALEEAEAGPLQGLQLHGNWTGIGCLGLILLTPTAWWTPSPRATDW